MYFFSFHCFVINRSVFSIIQRLGWKKRLEEEDFDEKRKTAGKESSWLEQIATIVRAKKGEKESGGGGVVLGPSFQSSSAAGSFSPIGGGRLSLAITASIDEILRSVNEQRTTKRRVSTCPILIYRRSPERAQQFVFLNFNPSFLPRQLIINLTVYNSYTVYKEIVINNAI